MDWKFGARLRQHGVLCLVMLALMAPAIPVSVASAQTGTPTSTISAVATICAPAVSATSEGDRYVVSVEELNLRAGPSTDCDIVSELERGDEVVLAGIPKSDGEFSWVPVSSADGNGYVIASSLQLVPDGATCDAASAFSPSTEEGFTSDSVNLRNGAGLGCAIVARLNAGVPVSVRGKTIERDGNTWLPVSTPMGDGYIVHDAYAAPGSWEAPSAVAVLMYHDLADTNNRFVVAPWQLEQQLIWLRDNGYTSITPRDLVAFLNGGAPLPPRPVILSVDDGWASARIFRDLLTSYGFRGTYMLPNYAELTPDEIYQLNQSGEVCGHSVSHPFLDQLDYDSQYYEIVENKAWLDSTIGTSTTCFSYPFGSFNETTTQIVIDAGYLLAFHAWDGVQYFDSIDRWHITRIEVSGEWDLATFASVVSF